MAATPGSAMVLFLEFMFGLFEFEFGGGQFELVCNGQHPRRM